MIFKKEILIQYFFQGTKIALLRGQQGKNHYLLCGYIA